MFEEYDVEALKKLLKDKTKDQILVIYSNKLSNLTKKQLIILALRIVEIDHDNWQETKRIISTKDARGQLLEVDEIRNAEGNKIGSVKREWEYYIDGSVDIITTTELDAGGNAISVSKVKHYTDGRQPEIIK